MDGLHELRELILRHARHDNGTALDGVRLTTDAEPMAGRAGFSEPSLAIVAQGVKRTVLNGTPYDYRAGQYLIVSIGLPVIGSVLEASREQPFAVFTLRLKPAVIASLLLETPSRGRAPAFSGLAISDATPELLDSAVRLVRLLDSPEDAPVLAAAYEREITWRLLTGAQGAIVRQIGLADGSLAQIARTIHWIRGHYTETLRIEDLARLAGMSLSTFHRHFRGATSMTPLQFQKQIRLQEARSLLLAGSDDIAEVGYLIGYDSPSQFSREYRRAFGAPPGRDALLLRGSSPAPG
ncbi:AraC family transcriptional regulator [Compostimonas suwonensis]|uniref:AraC-like DNA-binding protein n=1 Tax=Compostimonas suwonensis TaxID=1048394 RepID=A0A2M9BBA8_9MICO|nr:AraC family transcriptional regulator [Compostimonas suwonensis]PJJ55226.1 AraC-like DNA-binding protein [Compostimonas suwonensis]